MHKVQPFEPDIVKASVGKCMYVNIEECFGFIALIASLIGLSPQVYKAYITKVTRDVSMLMLVNYLICSLSWIGYGLYQSSIFVVLSNIAGLVISHNINYSKMLLRCKTCTMIMCCTAVHNNNRPAANQAIKKRKGG